jgi:NAD(P)-dependent dehydrogenase (short-subunit alcohol dehydrogenase family)
MSAQRGEIASRRRGSAAVVGDVVLFEAMVRAPQQFFCQRGVGGVERHSCGAYRKPRSGDCAAKCAVAWYTRGVACSLADALVRAMRERRGPRWDAPLAAWSAQREVSFLSSTVTFYANLAHSLTRSPYHL